MVEAVQTIKNINHHGVFKAMIGYSNTPLKLQKDHCVYRGRLCCVRELKFEPHDFLHHVREAGHRGDSRASVRTPGSARPLMALL